MKNILFKLSTTVLILSGFFCIWSFLIPERIAQHSSASVSADTSLSGFKAALLEEYQQAVHAKVSATLDNIYNSNQSFLCLLAKAQKEYGSSSKEVLELIELKDLQFGMHLKEVKDIIDKYGWLGENEIGAQNNYTLFTMIQAADFDTRQKYIPVMEKAVKSGSLAPENFASFVDRIAIVQHRKQIYGTLVSKDEQTGTFRFAPIADEKLVNERRAAIGLPPIEEYAQKL